MTNIVKKNDLVRVISGADRGKQGRVLEVCPKEGRIKVQGIAVSVRHTKARRQGEKSSIRMIERYIHVSNVTKVEA